MLDLPLSIFSKLRLIEKKFDNKFIEYLVSKNSSLLIYDNVIGSHMDEKEHNPTNHFYIPTRNYILMSFNLPRIEHQIAHMVDISVERTVIPDFGFGKFSETISKHHSPKAKNKAYFAATIRELRVRTIQLHIYDGEFNIDLDYAMAFDPKDVDESRFPFGKFKTKQDFINHCKNLAERTYNNWNKDKIEHEWNVRLNFIREQMNVDNLKIAALIMKIILC